MIFFIEEEQIHRWSEYLGALYLKIMRYRLICDVAKVWVFSFQNLKTLYLTDERIWCIINFHLSDKTYNFKIV